MAHILNVIIVGQQEIIEFTRIGVLVVETEQPNFQMEYVLSG